MSDELTTDDATYYDLFKQMQAAYGRQEKRQNERIREIRELRDLLRRIYPTLARDDLAREVERLVPNV